MPGVRVDARQPAIVHAMSRIRQELRERYDVAVLETGADPAVVRATLVGLKLGCRIPIRPAGQPGG